MTEQVDPRPEKQKNGKPRRITVAERVAAMQKGHLLPVRRSIKHVRERGPTPEKDARVPQLVKGLLDQAEEATAALAANPPPPLSVPRAPLELAVMHASNMMRKQKREPAHACLIASGPFGLDPEDVLQAWEKTQKRRDAKEDTNDTGDDFDDAGWDEDA